MKGTVMQGSRFENRLRVLLVTGLILSVTACAAIEGQESSGEYIDDTVITSKVKEAFIADSQIKSFQISVETMQGTVQLSGFVDSQANEARAIHIAAQIQGVKVVKDSLVIAPPQ